MLTSLNKIMAGVAVAAIGAVVVATARVTDRDDDAQWAHVAQPARYALTRAVDLNPIAGFRYINDRSFEVTDKSGKKYDMEFTQACPGLKDATGFSLVTANYRDMDRFTGIALQGRVCTFKDFAPAA